MAEHVISHRKPRRKRGGAWSVLLRRFGALAVTLAALATASWLAPYYYRPPLAPPAVERVEAPLPPPKLPPPEVSKTILLAEAGATGVEPHRQRRARRGVPLNARADSLSDDFEVLSAGELDAISQAQN